MMKRKKKIPRRDFLKQSLIGTSAVFSTPAHLFMASLFSEMIRSKEAQAAGASSDMNFVNFTFQGGAARWIWDLPLKPNASDPFVVNPAVGTKLDGNLKPIYQSVTDPLFNGIQMPYLWSSLIPRPNGGTTPMAMLAPNLLMIRGLNLQVDSHEVDRQKQIVPIPGVSLPGIAADVATTPIPAMSYNGDLGFVSRKGLSNVNTSGNNPISDALSPFTNATILTEITDSQVDTAIDNLLNLMKTGSASKHQYLQNTYSDRANAKVLMKTNFGNLQQAFTDLKNKYTTLLTRSFTESGLFLQNLETLVVPGSTTSIEMNLDQDLRYSGSNFNSIFTSSAKVNSLAEGMAVAEYMLVNGLTTSFSAVVNGIDGLLYDQLYTPSTKAAQNSVAAGMGLDMHNVGAVPMTILLTKYFRGYAACVYELISQLKATSVPGGGNLFQKTVIATTSDFNRSPRTDRSGSDHGFAGSCYSILSGMITTCEVVGNVTSDTAVGYTGTWGKAAPITQNSSNELLIGNAASTVAVLLGLPSPTPNESAVVTKNPNTGTVSLALPRGVNT